MEFIRVFHRIQQNIVSPCDISQRSGLRRDVRDTARRLSATVCAAAARTRVDKRRHTSSQWRRPRSRLPRARPSDKNEFKETIGKKTVLHDSRIILADA
ncbi:hypothetical protein EVAR_94013_1 [Eumeta japonica]|uniref:Uncharacterized protein n=1 Tax=Eumeta variegata TaxID=151549 RepID=A0A4C1TPG3_EUMVA|nr:hypothetical protein EVAR_94013_1 [Eumeta japonica]